MVKMVNCMLSVFYHNLKKNLKGNSRVEIIFDSYCCCETSLWKYNILYAISSCYHSQIERNPFLIVIMAYLSPSSRPLGSCSILGLILQREDVSAGQLNKTLDQICIIRGKLSDLNDQKDPQSAHKARV